MIRNEIDREMLTRMVGDPISPALEARYHRFLELRNAANHRTAPLAIEDLAMLALMEEQAAATEAPKGAVKHTGKKDAA